MGTVLTNLQDASGAIALAIQVGGVLVPVVKGLITKIEGIGTKTVTITFADLVTADLAELTAIQQLADADLAAINVELAKLGLPAIVIPPVTPPAPPAAT